MVEPEKAIALMKKGDEAPAVRPPASVNVTPEAVENTKRSIFLLQGMVKDMLAPNVDFGHVPGIKGEFLWDPGAAKIAACFNCYPGKRRIITMEMTGERVVVCVEVPLISRATGEIVGAGIGAASTEEAKFHNLWVEKPAEYGYTDEAIKVLKHREKGNFIQYKIPNPSPGDLTNTIVKMASKRAEVDAVETLPGVSSLLREMFDKPGDSSGPRNDYQWFWGETKRLGYKTNDEVHTALGLISMKDWTNSGRTLEQAIEALRKRKSPGESQKAGNKSQNPGNDSQKPSIEWNSPIDQGWFNETINTLRWNPDNLLTSICNRYKVPGSSLVEAINNLSREQAADLTEFLNNKLAK